ncbi:hypothetical protein AA0242T_2086 [Acetobacter aceti NRIC 0242]|uniref:Uncharacterized protein n=1 Tax=Acetobacter aceti NBRC 14818 TaxID=887700 RepID=A0AB33IEJ6_ACEAC|nr:hypothetical protein [Acetobacter aceti]TCS34300.1 hypothetical protein EDC15_104246 [Acetobacter aceti NBRC 14818]BCK75413.1 hypothetical protein EMQ_1019 [Acetobacter aceti NBRC 14818]GAN58666.1 hypothetical protein Abac_063_001 [Acetobacter aceti NBRC 14818]GBO81384.1 hypothetical protein AA0242T_2086 [Acetobacter aceti NRIC 0242]
MTTDIAIVRLYIVSKYISFADTGIPVDRASFHETERHVRSDFSAARVAT